MEKTPIAIQRQTLRLLSDAHRGNRTIYKILIEQSIRDRVAINNSAFQIKHIKKLIKEHQRGLLVLQGVKMTKSLPAYKIANDDFIKVCNRMVRETSQGFARVMDIYHLWPDSVNQKDLQTLTEALATKQIIGRAAQN